MAHNDGGCSKLQQISKTSSQLVKKVGPNDMFPSCDDSYFACQYNSFVQPLSTDEIELLYEDAINLPTNQQDAIPEALRAILVFHAFTAVPGRILGHSGKINGVYIANWDILPIPFNRAVRTRTLSSFLYTHCQRSV